MQYQFDCKLKCKALCGVFALVTGVAAAGGAQEEKPAPLPAWKPNPKMLRYLARPTRIASYVLQAPMGYTERQMRQTRVSAYIWLGQAENVGVVSSMTLAFAPAVPINNKPLMPEQLLASSLNALQRGHDDWTQTPTERGQINGLTFARAYWTGTERQRKRRLRGAVYLAVDGQTAIAMQCQDLNPDKKPAAQDANKTSAAPPDTAGDAQDRNGAENAPNAPNANGAENAQNSLDRLKLAEAAMQTFHRYVAPRPADPAPSPQ